MLATSSPDTDDRTAKIVSGYLSSIRSVSNLKESDCLIPGRKTRRRPSIASEKEPLQPGGGQRLYYASKWYFSRANLLSFRYPALVCPFWYPFGTLSVPFWCLWDTFSTLRSHWYLFGTILVPFCSVYPFLFASALQMPASAQENTLLTFVVETIVCFGIMRPVKHGRPRSSRFSPGPLMRGRCHGGAKKQLSPRLSGF